MCTPQKLRASSMIAMLAVVGVFDLGIGVGTVGLSVFGWVNILEVMEALSLKIMQPSLALIVPTCMSLTGLLGICNSIHLFRKMENPDVGVYSILQTTAYVIQLAIISAGGLSEEFAIVISILNSKTQFEYFILNYCTFNSFSITLFFVEILKVFLVFWYKFSLFERLNPTPPHMTLMSRLRVQLRAWRRYAPTAVDIEMGLLQCTSRRPYSPSYTRRVVNADIFNKVKKDCLKRKALFEDIEFPACSTSLGYLGLRDEDQIEWKRPYEITEHPVFRCNRNERYKAFEVIQSRLGNCWFVAVIAGLTLYMPRFEMVVLDDNSFEKKQYCGIFHFRFWDFSAWHDIVIDDRLPTINNKLAFLHSETEHEFWPALLEKAYAKFRGSYANLVGKCLRDGFLNLTNGRVSRFALQHLETITVYAMIKRSLADNCLVGIAKSDSFDETLSFETISLTSLFAYSICGINRFSTSGTNEAFVKLRNPFASFHDWDPQSRGHWLWRRLDKATHSHLNLIYKQTTEFWFPLKDVLDIFDIMEICHPE